MKVPVFLEIPLSRRRPELEADDRWLRPMGAPPERALPDDFVIDRHFPRITVGAGAAMAERRTSSLPQSKKSVAVRGTIEVDSIDDVPEELDGKTVQVDPIVDVYSTCFNDQAVGTDADVAAKLNVAALHRNGLDGDEVAIAIIDTGINLAFLEQKLGFRPKLDLALSWRPPGVSVNPGEFPVGHGTMCAYAALIAAPKATLIDVPVFVGTPAGGAPIARRLSNAYRGIAELSAAWTIAFTASGARKYKALVLSNSWGMYHPSADFPPGHPGRYSDNPLHLFTRTISGLIEVDEVDVVFAAGNCGGDCPDEKCQGVTSGTITGANASRNVLTVAGCNTLGQRVGYSSQGPGIAGMEHEKPDIAAYTHFKGSEALGTGVPDKGTSTACPAVAGCIAALRTKLSFESTSPIALNALLRQTATHAQTAAWNGNLGFGIIDPLAAAQASALIPES